jgi:hypothetical protein
MAPPVTTAYQERLRFPWLWWPPVLAGTGLLVTPIGLSLPGGLRPLLIVGPVLAVAAGLWWLGRIQVAVALPPAGVEAGSGADGDDGGGGGGELWVDDARLPVRFIRTVVPLDAAGRRELLGVSADPLAFVVQRPWIGGAVQVVLDDPADPTPYWLISTRAPDRLATALGQAGGPGEAGHGS